MPNSLNLTLSYRNQQHLLHIGSDIELLENLLCLIGEYFDINIDNFIVEIYDQRYKLFVILDNYYLTDLRSNLFFVGNTSVNGRIRLRNQSAFNKASDISSLSITSFDDLDVRPDHVVVWLDRYIGQPDEYKMLKRRYNNMTNPYAGCEFDDLTTNDINSLICLDSDKHLIYSLAPEQILYPFSDVHPCLDFINSASASQKTIFLICSENLGSILVPQIFDNIFIRSIYILMNDIQKQLSWLMDHYHKILIFEHESDLFSRSTRDIASYYGEKCLVDYRISNFNLLFLKWAQTLYERADKNDKRAVPYVELKNIKERIQQIESSLENHQKCEEMFYSNGNKP